MKIFLDADASPVTEDVIHIASNKNIPLTIVKNYSQNISSDYPEIISVDIDKESADLYIVNHLNKNDLVITQDRGLSALCIGKGSYVMDFFGNLVNNDNINVYLGIRHVNTVLRKQGIYSKNKKRNKKDNLLFKQNLIDFLEEKNLW